MDDCYSGNISVVLAPGSKMTRRACWPSISKVRWPRTCYHRASSKGAFYCIRNHWEALNNQVERLMKRIAVGRKNRLFLGSLRAGIRRPLGPKKPTWPVYGYVVLSRSREAFSIFFRSVSFCAQRRSVSRCEMSSRVWVPYF